MFYHTFNRPYFSIDCRNIAKFYATTHTPLAQLFAVTFMDPSSILLPLKCPCSEIGNSLCRVLFHLIPDAIKIMTAQVVHSTNFLLFIFSLILPHHLEYCVCLQATKRTAVAPKKHTRRRQPKHNDDHPPNFNTSTPKRKVRRRFHKLLQQLCRSKQPNQSEHCKFFCKKLYHQHTMKKTNYFVFYHKKTQILAKYISKINCKRQRKKRKWTNKAPLQKTSTHSKTHQPHHFHHQPGRRKQRNKFKKARRFNSCIFSIFIIFLSSSDFLELVAGSALTLTGNFDIHTSINRKNATVIKNYTNVDLTNSNNDNNNNNNNHNNNNNKNNDKYPKATHYNSQVRSHHTSRQNRRHKHLYLLPPQSPPSFHSHHYLYHNPPHSFSHSSSTSHECPAKYWDGPSRRCSAGLYTSLLNLSNARHPKLMSVERRFEDICRFFSPFHLQIYFSALYASCYQFSWSNIF